MEYFAELPGVPTSPSMSTADVQSPLSTYSYPSRISLSPAPATAQFSAQGTPSERRIPRLSSPNHFRDIFASDGTDSTSRRTRHLDPPPINYQETMDGVNRALQSANRAIQTAQEAFQSRLNATGNASRRPDVVDLTQSPPTATGAATTEDGAFDAFLSRITQTRHPRSNTDDDRRLDSPLHGFRPPPLIRDFSDEEFISSFTGPDSAIGPRRRYEAQRRTLGTPNMERILVRSGMGDASRRDEEEAIRRQRLARQQWDDNQRRNTERQRLEAQRQRILASPQQQRSTVNSQRQTLSSPIHPSIATSSSGSSIEAVDLTKVDDSMALNQALSTIQEPNSQNQNRDNIGTPTSARTSLTSYKCPICMEPPQIATTTVCGHLFCHKCIIDTLKWSENQRREEVAPTRRIKGVCPVCRKETSRKEEPGVGRALVPLEIKRVSKADREKILKRKRIRDEIKGKEKYVEDGDRVGDSTEETTSNVGNEVPKGRPSKRAKTVKRDTEDMDSLFDYDDGDLLID